MLNFIQTKKKSNEELIAYYEGKGKYIEGFAWSMIMIFLNEFIYPLLISKPILFDFLFWKKVILWFVFGFIYGIIFSKIVLKTIKKKVNLDS
ncbi:hypothetical protein [Aureivirga marina]|uniref:hypothetical protein n=1 Tax=Aureivirga marina TaxID=1182451 RepID=UPI0018CAEE5D|nr:hypothetical protein [Aureivirga marina]